MISEDYKMMPDSYDDAKDLAYSSGKLFEIPEEEQQKFKNKA